MSEGVWRVWEFRAAAREAVHTIRTEDRAPIPWERIEEATWCTAALTGLCLQPGTLKNASFSLPFSSLML